MSGSNSQQIPAPINTTTVATNLLACMYGLTGQVTDATQGSIVRAWAESIGALSELVTAQNVANSLNTIVNQVYEVFGITPYPATAATGEVVFYTGNGANIPYSVNIPQGTIVATNSGVQFQTTQNATLIVGTSAVTVPIIATQTGPQGNVPANTIVQIINALPYPLFVTNPNQTTGGQTAETPQQTANRFAAKVQSLQQCTPLAIVNQALQITNGTERVVQAAVYEPWITNSSAGAGFTLYIDNGSGTASSGLVLNVSSGINAPAGVPYIVAPVTPVSASVNITASVVSTYSNQEQLIYNNILTAVQQFFSELQIGETLYASQLSAVVANAAPAQLSSLNVSVNNGALSVNAQYNQRVVLSSITISLT
jgi:uncharacterized phage protein gp47/JayE